MKYYIEEDKRIYEDLVLCEVNDIIKPTGRLFYLRVYDFNNGKYFKNNFLKYINNMFGTMYNKFSTKKSKIKIIFDKNEKTIPFNPIKNPKDYEEYAKQNGLIIGCVEYFPKENDISISSKYYGVICKAYHGMKGYNKICCGNGNELEINKVSAYFYINKMGIKNKIGVRYIVIS